MTKPTKLQLDSARGAYQGARCGDASNREVTDRFRELRELEEKEVYEDVLRCPSHGHVISNGMFDSPCPACEQAQEECPD